MTAVSFRSGD